MATADANLVRSEKRSGRKWLLPLGAGLLLLFCAGAFLWFNTSRATDETSDTGASVRESGRPPVFVTVEPITVNLQPEGGEKFLQIALTVQLADEGQMELFKEYMPEVRNRLILLLSSKKASEISMTDGKTKLSDDILTQMKQPMGSFNGSKNVIGTFLTSFVIQ